MLSHLADHKTRWSNAIPSQRRGCHTHNLHLEGVARRENRPTGVQHGGKDADVPARRSRHQRGPEAKLGELALREEDGFLRGPAHAP